MIDQVLKKAIGMYAISAQIVAYLIDAGFPPLQAATACSSWTHRHDHRHKSR
jgi:hypothetical protein